MDSQTVFIVYTKQGDFVGTRRDEKAAEFLIMVCNRNRPENAPHFLRWYCEQATQITLVRSA